MKKKLLLLSFLAGSLVAYSADQEKKPASRIQEEITVVEDKLPQTPTEYTEEESVPLVKVQKKAEFPGGKNKLMEYLIGNIKYPEEAANKSIEGTVLVKFVVKKDGYVDNINVLRGVDPILDEEAIRVVKNMPKWIPAQNAGKDVASYFTLPIRFSIGSEDKSDKK